MRIAVLDDWQEVARSSADWSALEKRAPVTFMSRPPGGTDELAEALAPFGIIIAMRERTPFPAALIDRLPRLRMIALTGARTWTMDFAALNARGIIVCNTGAERAGIATAELALALLLASARQLPAADRAVRAGRFQAGVPAGMVLEGRTLGIVGLGRIGSRLAGYARALGMHVLAWSANLTDATAQAAGATRVEKAALLERSDAVSLHLVLSERTRGIIGAADLARMKRGAILINTSRGPLVDETALVEAARSGHIRAALDVYAQEPLPAGHGLAQADDAVLTPHLGYCSAEVYAQFYRESIENVEAFLDGRPQRVINPEAIRRA